MRPPRLVTPGMRAILLLITTLASATPAARLCAQQPDAVSSWLRQNSSTDDRADRVLRRPHVSKSMVQHAAVVDAKQIELIARGVEGVRGCHRIRSRGTELAAHVDLHLLVPDDVSLLEAHEISHRVEAALRERLPQVMDVTIHVEPETDGDEDL